VRAGSIAWVLGAAAALVLLPVVVRLLEPLATFFPVRDLPLEPGAFGLPYDTLQAVTSDGLHLRGWFVPAPGPPGEATGGGRVAPLTLVVFHGNAENIAFGLDLAQRARAAGWATALAEYRGYAGNPGSPSEEGIARDGEAFVRAVAARPDVDPGRLVIWGRSIGSAVAVRLAANGHGAALVLESPFTSARELLRASGAWPLWAMSFAGSYRFDQAALMPRVRVPVLVIHGTADEVVPFRLGRRLYDLAPGPKTFLAIDGGGHNDLLARHGDALWAGAEGFLRSLPAAGRQTQPG
jgi:fermentation-respiration switch protein FrsA (DUF1100 family)